MVTPAKPETQTAQVARSVQDAIQAAGENPHSVAIATGIAYQTLLRNLRGEERWPFDVHELDRIAKHLGIPQITAFFEVAA